MRKYFPGPAKLRDFAGCARIIHGHERRPRENKYLSGQAKLRCFADFARIIHGHKGRPREIAIFVVNF